jgi:hypothetical protein
MGWNTSRLQGVHNEGIELIVHHAFAIQLLYPQTIEGRGIISEIEDITVWIISFEY